VVILALIAASVLQAGPREFGLQELHAAMSARGLGPGQLRLRIELNNDPPQSWRIEATRISGGDLAGLMYGMLEAAEQIRLKGRLEKAQGSPAFAVRAVRVPLSESLPAEVNANWRDFLQMLALHRFNRVQVLAEPPPENFLRSLAEAAAQFAIEVEPRLWRPPLPESVVREQRVYRAHSPLEGLDWLWADPVHARREIRVAMMEGYGGIAIDAAIPFPPRWLFYLLWGRLAFQPNLKDSLLSAEFHRRYGKEAPLIWEALTLASRALSFRRPPDLFFSSPEEAARNRVEQRKSARLSPLALAGVLYQHARQAELAVNRLKEKPDIEPDLRNLIKAARLEARRLTIEDFAAMYHLTGNDSALRAVRRLHPAAQKLAGELGVELRAPGLGSEQPRNFDLLRYPAAPAKPEFIHIPPPRATAGQPATLSLRVTPAHAIQTVRLHYSTSSAPFQTIQAPAAHASFTVTPGDTLLYYFEVIHKNGSGWFLPDPFSDTPYFHVRVQEKPIAVPQP